MPVRSALESLTLPPTRFLRSSWPWRSLLYLTSGGLLGLSTLMVLYVLLVAGVVLALVAIGFAALVGFALSGVVVAKVERKRLRLVDSVELPDAHVVVPKPGVLAWVRTRLREPLTWRELGFTMVSVAVLSWLDLAFVVVVVWSVGALLCAPLYIDSAPLPVTFLVSAGGVVLALVAAYPVTAWAAARAAMTRAILAPRHDDDPRLVELTRSRARLVDAFEVERRRIERDLHDGAQQRLVALSMHLGMARLELPGGSPAGESVRRAHDLAKEALSELRELIRGVHPKILTDRGLEAAVREIVDRAPVPVDVDMALPTRLSQPVEATAYFVVVEALNNVAKHSGAERAQVLASVAFDRLTVQIRDDGRGGADPSCGTGLSGLVDRVAAVGGTVAFASPTGGPTVVRVELPCGS